MGSPIIGVTTSAETTAKGVERSFVNAAYIRAVERAGGVPLLLTPHHSPAALARLADLVDGLLLTGGGDIDPARWGEARHPATDLVSTERDELELERVTRQAIDTGLPLLAIWLSLPSGGGHTRLRAQGPPPPATHPLPACHWGSRP